MLTHAKTASAAVSPAVLSPCLWSMATAPLAAALPSFSLDIVGVVASYLVCRPLLREGQLPIWLTIVQGEGQRPIWLKIQGTETSRSFLASAWYYGSPLDQHILVHRWNTDASVCLQTLDTDSFQLGTKVPLTDSSPRFVRKLSRSVCSGKLYMYDPTSGMSVYSTATGKLVRRVPYETLLRPLDWGAAFAIHPVTGRIYMNKPRENTIVILNQHKFQRTNGIKTSFIDKLSPILPDHDRIDCLLFQPKTNRLCVDSTHSVFLMDDDGSNLIRVSLSKTGNVQGSVQRMAFDQHGRIFVCLSNQSVTVCDPDGAFRTSIDLRDLNLNRMNRRPVVNWLFVDIYERIWIDDGVTVNVYGCVDQ